MTYSNALTQKVITEAKIDPQVTKMALDFFNECRRLYFSNDTDTALEKITSGASLEGYYRKVTIPKFVFRRSQRAWGYYDPKRHLMNIHPDLILYPNTFRRVVFHETIHVFDPYGRVKVFDPFYGKTRGHGTFFEEKMKEINAKEGSAYVTVKGDYEEVTQAASDFYVMWFWQKHRPVFWAVKNEADVKAWFERFNFDRALASNAEAGKIHALKTNLRIWDTGFKRPTARARFSVLNPGAEAEKYIQWLKDQTDFMTHEIKKDEDTPPYWIVYWFKGDELRFASTQKYETALQISVLPYTSIIAGKDTKAVYIKKMTSPLLYGTWSKITKSRYGLQTKFYVAQPTGDGERVLSRLKMEGPDEKVKIYENHSADS